MPVNWFVTTDVIEVLQGSTFTATSVTLPAGELPRPLYEAVNKVLVGAGGKWDRRTRTHLFAQDPRTFLSEVLKTREAVNLKTLKQAFYTPDWLAQQLVHAAQLEMQYLVLEPEAGMGAIALQAAAYVVPGQVHCYEMDLTCVQYLTAQGFPAKHQDFLLVPPRRVFDRVLMNPPWAHDQGIRHVAHAAQFLRPGGELFVLLPSTAGQHHTRAHQEFVALMDTMHGERTTLPAGTFKASGTNVGAVMIHLRFP